MNVTYLYHSGFLVETEACYYLFDYYKGNLPKLDTSKPIIVLSSHSHRDHYNPHIFSILQEMGLQRIYGVLADDIPPTALSDVINCLSVTGGREYTLALGQQLITYQSTDEGVAFLIKEGDSVIYHAGDLNDWVWEEEDSRYNEQMTLDYRRQIDALADQLGGHPLSCAFVVLDPRQGKDYDRGMLYFLEKVKVHKVYPMHYWEKPQIMKQFLEEHPQYQALVQKNNCSRKEEKMKFEMYHENYNVTDLERSLAFYEKALGLKETHRKTTDDFIIVFIGNEESTFELELTWLKDHPQPYDLGECEFHLAFRTDDFEAAHKLHEEMGCICYENPGMGIYFISDPDGYWLEIVPVR